MTNKRIRFSRETINCKPFITDVMNLNDEGDHYYFYDEKQIYKRIKKKYENQRYTITSVFSKTNQEATRERNNISIFGSSNNWL